LYHDPPEARNFVSRDSRTAAGYLLHETILEVRMKVFLCKKCAAVAEAAANPDGKGCPAGGVHDWTYCGEQGTMLHLCGKCKTVLRTFAPPADFGCPKGAYHEWVHLGASGSERYTCKKCAVGVECSAMPEAKGCPAGGAHAWKKG
jgi:hypothetical protein